MAGLALLVACGGPSDTSLHAAVLAADLESVEVADCGTIRHEELRGECQLYAAFTVGSRRGEELGPRCDAVDEGVWRDECYFLAAEDLRRRQRDFAAAGALCARSSRFVDDCGQHLWQSPVKVIVDRHLATGDLESALAEATPVYCEWETILGEDSDIASRFWRIPIGRRPWGWEADNAWRATRRITGGQGGWHRGIVRDVRRARRCKRNRRRKRTSRRRKRCRR